MKFLKDKEYEYMLKCKINMDCFRQQKYWFSEWRQLNPIFEWIEGKQSVIQARDEFRSLSAESLGYSLNQIKKMENELIALKKRLSYYENIILTHELNKTFEK